MKRSLFLAVICCLPALPALAGSTVNPNVPGTGSNLTSAPIRGNFAATFTDINNLLTGFAAPNAPTNPSVGQFWRKTNISPQIVYQWSGTSWLPYSTLDISGSKVTPYFGNSLLAWQQLLTGSGGLGTSGQCIISTGPSTVPTTQNCVAAATVNATAPLSWNPGTLTMSLGYTGSFTLSGSNLALASTILSGGPVGTGTTTPVITYNQYGQLTAVSAATITPPFTAITGQAALAQLPNIADQTVLGNVTGGSAVPATLSKTQLTTLVNIATGSLSGAVPAWPGTTNTFFRGDGTYAQPSAANLSNGVTGTGQIVLSNSPTLVSPTLGAASATSINGLTITSGTGTLTITSGKTFSVSNSLTLTGTDSTSFTFPGSSDTVVTLSATQTLSNKSISATQLTGTLQAGQFPALTGDITTSSGSLATALATVNSNVGSFGSSTSIPTFTVNAKGLITAVSGNAVVAPAGTLTGTTLASGVVSSSLTSVGTISSGIWQGSVVGLSYGGTGSALTASNGGIVYSNASTLAILSGTPTAGQCLLSGSNTAPSWGSCSGGASVASVSNSDGTLVVSPTTGAVVASLDLTHANTWTGVQTFTTPVLGAATATSINKVTITAPASSATLTIANGKTMTVNNSLTLAGTDSTTMTFPSTSATIPQVIASGSTAMGTSAIGSASCATAVTVPATGVATTDALIVSFNQDVTATTGYVPLVTGMLSIFPYPTANNVNFKVCNGTAGSITPSAVTLNWRVVR